MTIIIDTERPADLAAREALLDRAMGEERFLKPSQRLREGRDAAHDLSLVARDGDALVGTVRLWSVDAGGCLALLLGPLAVDPARQGEGIGSRLMRRALNRAAASGHGAVILVGDASYYARFGFDAALTRGLDMLGDVDPKRFLGLELRKGALAGASGAVTVPMLPVLEPMNVRWGDRVAA